MQRWQDVLEELVRTRYPALVSYAWLFTPRRADAEDLVHEALVRAFGRPRSIRDARAAEGYVRRAIRSEFLDSHRRWLTTRRKAHLVATDPHSDARVAQRAAATVDVHAALAALPPRHRACAVLRYFDDLPLAEIAAELGLGVGTVKRYLHDATATLRETLGVEVPDPSGTDHAPIALHTGRTGR